MKGLPSDLKLHVVNNIDEAWAMKAWAGERREVLGLDTETSGLNPYASGSKLRTIQLGDHHNGWLVPWEQWGGVAMEILEMYEEGPIAVHNLSFDEKWMRIFAGWDVPWHRMHDTMIHYNMLYPGQPAALKTVTDKHIDPRASLGEKQLKKAFEDNGWGWHNVPVDYPAFALYSALDPVITAHIWSFLRADQKYPESFDLEMSVLRICAGMEDRGIPVDVDYCMRALTTLDEWVGSAKTWGQDQLGVSITSNDQLSSYFQNQGIEPVKFTKSGKPSMDVEALEIISANENRTAAEVAKFVLQFRKMLKIKSGYFENFIRDNTNGLLHPGIKTMQAVTSRMSIVRPALQTLHKNDKMVRKAIVPREGEVLISSDLDQVEFRIFAHLSQDKNLIETFLHADETGSDTFTEIGKQIYGDPAFQKSDPRRGLVKNVIYGKLYGAGVAKMAQSAGVAESVMQEVESSLMTRFPGIKSYQKESDRLLQGRLAHEGLAYIETGVTKRRIPVDSDATYRGVNYEIQSSAAEIMKSNLIEIDRAGLGEYLLLPVHDEVILSVPEDIAEEAKQTVADCMTTTEGWAVPLTSGAEGPFDWWGQE